MERSFFHPNHLTIYVTRDWLVCGAICQNECGSYSDPWRPNSIDFRPRRGQMRHAKNVKIAASTSKIFILMWPRLFVSSYSKGMLIPVDQRIVGYIISLWLGRITFWDWFIHTVPELIIPQFYKCCEICKRFSGKICSDSLACAVCPMSVSTDVLVKAKDVYIIIYMRLLVCTYIHRYGMHQAFIIQVRLSVCPCLD